MQPRLEAKGDVPDGLPERLRRAPAASTSSSSPFASPNAFAALNEDDMDCDDEIPFAAIRPPRQQQPRGRSALSQSPDDDADSKMPAVGMTAHAIHHSQRSAWYLRGIRAKTQAIRNRAHTRAAVPTLYAQPDSDADDSADVTETEETDGGDADDDGDQLMESDGASADDNVDGTERKQAAPDSSATPRAPECAADVIQTLRMKAVSVFASTPTAAGDILPAGYDANSAIDSIANPLKDLLNALSSPSTALRFLDLLLCWRLEFVVLRDGFVLSPQQHRHTEDILERLGPFAQHLFGKPFCTTPTAWRSKWRVGQRLSPLAVVGSFPPQLELSGVQLDPWRPGSRDVRKAVWRDVADGRTRAPSEAHARSSPTFYSFQKHSRTPRFEKGNRKAGFWREVAAGLDTCLLGVVSKLRKIRAEQAGLTAAAPSNADSLLSQDLCASGCVLRAANSLVCSDTPYTMTWFDAFPIPLPSDATSRGRRHPHYPHRKHNPHGFTIAACMIAQVLTQPRFLLVNVVSGGLETATNAAIRDLVRPKLELKCCIEGVKGRMLFGVTGFDKQPRCVFVTRGTHPCKVSPKSLVSFLGPMSLVRKMQERTAPPAALFEHFAQDMNTLRKRVYHRVLDTSAFSTPKALARAVSFGVPKPKPKRRIGVPKHISLEAKLERGADDTLADLELAFIRASERSIERKSAATTSPASLDRKNTKVACSNCSEAMKKCDSGRY